MVIAFVVISFSGYVFGVAVVGIALPMLFLRRVQMRCPADWERLGLLSPILPHDVRTGWRLTKYIMRGRFAHLEDRGLIALGRLLCVLSWIWTLGWAMVIGLVSLAIILSWLH
jgi:hypothetical protein